MNDVTRSPFDDRPCANTDREIWRKGDGDANGMSYYEPSIHVTEQGAIGINVGGHVFTMPVEDWHRLAKGDGLESHSEALGYTLGTGRLFAPMAAFHAWAEKMLGRPILTHEFASHDTWDELRAVFEEAAIIRVPIVEKVERGE